MFFSSKSTSPVSQPSLIIMTTVCESTSLIPKFDTNCSELTQEQADKQECNGDEEFITMDDIDYTRPQDYYIFHDSKHCIKKTDWPELSNGPTGYTNPMTRKATHCN